MTNAFRHRHAALDPGHEPRPQLGAGARERPSATQVIWTAITTLGCLLAVSGTRSTSMSLGDFSRLELYAAAVDVRFVGGICVLLAQCAAFACFAVLQKHVLVACPPLFSVVAWTHQISALFCILTAVGCGQASALVAADAAREVC